MPLPLPPLRTLPLVLVHESCAVGEADVCRQNVGVEDVIDGRLGCVRLVMSLKLLLKWACHLLVVRSADVAAAGCVVALGAKLLSPLSFSVSLIVEADEVRRICHYYHGYNVGRAVSCTVALRLVSSSSLD